MPTQRLDGVVLNDKCCFIIVQRQMDAANLSLVGTGPDDLCTVNEKKAKIF